MAIRISCPSCKTVNNIDEEKRGRKVRCRKCEKPISVPAEDVDVEAVQAEPKLKVKAGASRNKKDDKEGDEDEERPAKKRKKEPAKKGAPLFLILGGVAAVLLLCLVGVAGGGGWYFFIREKPTEKVVAKAEPTKEEKKLDVRKTDPDKKDPDKKDPDMKDPDTKDPDPKTTEPTKVGDLTFGKTRPSGDKTIVVVEIPLIGPAEKIKQVQVEVWIGTPTAGRPYSYKKPMPLPGDGDRQTHAVTRRGASATSEIPVPALIPPGKVVWVQPVIVLADDSRQWGVAVAMPLVTAPPPPYELKPANLVANFQTPKQRTVKLKYTLKADTKEFSFDLRADADILEVVTPEPEGAQMPTAFGAITISADEKGQKFPLPKEVTDLIRAIPATYGLDPNSKVRKRTYREIDAKVVKGGRDYMQALQSFHQLGMTYESTLMPFPNKLVQPKDTWPTIVPVIMRLNQKNGEIQLVLVSTYEGILAKGNRSEAIVTVTGKVRAVDPDFKDSEGDVTGKIGFDETGGYISSASLKFTSAKDVVPPYTLDIDLTRVPGNGLNIKLPTDPKTKPDPDPVAKGKIIFEKKAALAVTDPGDPTLSDPNPKKKKVAHMKDFTVKLEMGKPYAITLHSTAFDPFLKLYLPNGQLLDFRPGQGGTARINIPRAPVTADFRIFAISHNGKTGAFHLTVTENP